MDTPIEDFRYTIDRFADLKVMRYRVPGWENLSLPQKELLYCLSQAANFGRDILFAQNYRYNILLKRVLEAIYNTFTGNRATEDFRNFEIYLKRFWFSNGIHHHYACDKFLPDFPPRYLKECIEHSDMEAVLQQLRNCPQEELRFNDAQDLGEFVCSLVFDMEKPPSASTSTRRKAWWKAWPATTTGM